MTRPRAKYIKVYGTSEELRQIEQLAESTNLSRSSYLLTAGLNKPIRSIMDINAVQELSKVNGDLGRVAGLLKLWLAEQRGLGAHPKAVEQMMNDFRKLQKQSHEIMGRMLR